MRKNGPRIVFFSIPAADCAIWKQGCWANAFSKGGNLAYVKRDCSISI